MRAVAAALVLAAAPAFAADVQLWTEAGVSRDLGARLALSLDLHVRLDQDISRLKSLMPELGVQLRATDWLRLGAGYRLEYERDGAGELVVRHRLHVNGRARLDVGPVRLAYRLQLQESLRPSSRDVARHTVRNRAEVVLRKLRPATPFASVELHHDVAEDELVALDKVWLTAGCGFGRGALDAEIFYRVEVPVDDPVLHIVGLAFHYGL